MGEMSLEITEELTVDILILGGGGAALMCALHATDQVPTSRVLMVVKGLLGKSGCTRMVQGGMNAVLNPKDSLEAHFRDTVVGGAFLNDQELVWLLVTRAPRVVFELENRYGVLFDRDEYGRIHQKPFAGQSFNRTVHKGDLTGIEVMERLREAVWARSSLAFLEDAQAVALLPGKKGGIGGALVLDHRSGRFLVVRAKATVLATGGGPTFYRFSTPSREKSLDGIALAYRAGAELMDLEMIQFHPTGLVCPDSELNGAVLEEGLRGAGAVLLNARGERFMVRYDPTRMERSTRDIVARAAYLEIMEGRGTPQGGVYIDISHLGREKVEAMFPGMVERTRMAGYDLATGPVEVCPTAHFIMGGVRIDEMCRTSLPGLYAAGEDAAGVHGANRLGGNGIAESLVFGALAGEVLREEVTEKALPEVDILYAREAVRELMNGLSAEQGESPTDLWVELKDLMWSHVGVVREEALLREAVRRLEELRERAKQLRVGPTNRFNLTLMQALSLRNAMEVAWLVAQSALHRNESRGAHFRRDQPRSWDAPKNLVLRRSPDGKPSFEWRSPRMTRLQPEELGKWNERS
jgi:succinate dehydrogenase/fumarate reductase flavoprotein subunit